MDTMQNRAIILDRAKTCVCGQREEDYGTPEDNMRLISELWTAYCGSPISPVDVAMMMGLLKIARIKGHHATEDSFVDLAGYAAVGGELLNRLIEKKKEDDIHEKRNSEDQV